jgi:hypothetical protein
MRSTAISTVATCLFILNATVLADNKCQCKPPVNGGVQCEPDQSAGCDPSSGTCQCTCTTVVKGKPAEVNLSTILTATFRRPVPPAVLTGRKLLDRVTEQNSSTFVIVADEKGSALKTPITLGVPEWFASDLQPFVRLQNSPNIK